MTTTTTTTTTRVVQDAVTSLARFVEARDGHGANYSLGYITGLVAGYMANKSLSEDFAKYVAEFEQTLKRNA